MAATGCCDVAPPPPAAHTISHAHSDAFGRTGSKHSDFGRSASFESLGARPVMARRMSRNEASRAFKDHAGPGASGHELLPYVREDPAKAAEHYFLASVQPGDWTKAAEVRQVVERRGHEREVCRAVAKASEGIAVHTRGLDSLVEQGTLQALIKEWTPHSNDTALAVNVHNLVARFWERATGDGQWLLLPTSVVTAKAILGHDRAEWLGEGHKAAVTLHSKGSLAAAAKLYEIVTERMTQLLGPADQVTLQAQNNMAVLLEERGQLDEAAKLFQEVSARLEEKLGADHPITLSSKFNQAALKVKQGSTVDAEALYKQVAEQREKILGAGHADTLRVRGNLAELLRRQGRLQEAEAMLHDIVEKRHAANGRDDAETLASRCSLARVLAQQGDPALARQAEAHFREVVLRREQRLGQGHPETLAAISRLAHLLEERRPDEAEQLHEQVWTWLDNVVTVERRRTRSRQGTFVSNLEETGEPEKAEAMLRQVVERRRSALGAGHPDTLAASAELAALLSRRHTERASAEALEMWRDLREMCESSLGLEHVDTLAVRAALAGSMLRQAAHEAEKGSPGAGAAARAEADALHSDTITRFVAAMPAPGAAAGGPIGEGNRGASKVAVDIIVHE